MDGKHAHGVVCVAWRGWVTVIVIHGVILSFLFYYAIITYYTVLRVLVNKCWDLFTKRRNIDATYVRASYNIRLVPYMIYQNNLSEKWSVQFLTTQSRSLVRSRTV